MSRAHTPISDRSPMSRGIIENTLVLDQGILSFCGMAKNDELIEILSTGKTSTDPEDKDTCVPSSINN